MHVIITVLDVYSSSMRVLLLALILMKGRLLGFEYDLAGSLGSEGEEVEMNTPRVYKVFRQIDEEPLEKDGWVKMQEDNTLLYDQQFLDHFLVTEEMVDLYDKGELQFWESKCFYCLLSFHIRQT